MGSTDRPSGQWKRWREVEETISDSFRQKKRKPNGAGASEVGRRKAWWLMVRSLKIGVCFFNEEDYNIVGQLRKNWIVQRFLHHSCQQFAQTVNGQPLWRRGLQRRCCPGRGHGDILEAARTGKVGAVRHLLRTQPGSVQQTDLLGPGPQMIHGTVNGGWKQNRRLCLICKL